MKFKRIYLMKKCLNVRFDEENPNKILETDLPERLCQSGNYVVGICGRNVRQTNKKTIKTLLVKIMNEKTLYLDILACDPSSPLLSKNAEVCTVWYRYKTCLKLFKSVLIGISTHKNPILAISQSKIGRKLGILYWAGIGLKLNHFGHRYGYKTFLKGFKSIIIKIPRHILT